MIAEQIQQQNTEYAASTKYYQFSTILEHVIDCLHTIVTDETNPYHPPLAWLTRKQPKPPDEELFLDLYEECTNPSSNSNGESNDNFVINSGASKAQLSSSVRARLEKCPQQQRQEIVSRTRDGCAPLFNACKNGLTRIVKYLLDVCGADTEQRGLYEALEDHRVHSVTPIWVAAVSGHLDTVKTLIDRGADVNTVSDTGSTPLRSVCFLCKDDDGQEEHDNFQEENEYNFGGTTEQTERCDTYMEIVYLLVENGGDPKRPNYNGGTCLINSLHNYHLANYIIGRGVDVDAPDHQSKTALHYAIQQKRVAVVKLLLASGANPFLQTRDSDDALQLCCIGGHEELFEHLIQNYAYDARRISDAYKLLGSSILEIHYDLARVRKYWKKSLEFIQQTRSSSRSSAKITCDIRRSRAFCSMIEFWNESSLQSLTVDDFRVQSLIISERILGSGHRETIQRLLYRGTFYINSLRPDRCLDLWIYALKLRLENDSIFHFESIFAAQAITKLFLDLLSQRQRDQVRFNDVFDVLQQLVCHVYECERHLNWMPRSCLHEDMFDILLNIIVKLLLILRCVQRHGEDFTQASCLVSQLARLNPRTTNGSSLLHICVNSNMFEGEIYRSLQVASNITRARVPSSEANFHRANANQHLTGNSSNTIRGLEIVGQEQQQPRAADQQAANGLLVGESGPSVESADSFAPVVQLIESLIDAGLEVDLINNDGLSALQMLCLANSIRVTDKTKIVKLLVQRGAHVDRRALTPEQGEQIRQTLRECGIKSLAFVTLKCLAARRVSELRLLKAQGSSTMLAANLRESIAIH